MFGNTAGGELTAAPAEIGNHGHWPMRYRSVYILWGPSIPHETLPEFSIKEIAGRLAGLLYLAGSAAALLMLALPRVPHHDVAVVVALAVAGAAWGVACLTVVPWERAGPWVSHASTSAGFVITAVMSAGDRVSALPASAPG